MNQPKLVHTIPDQHEVGDGTDGSDIQPDWP
jgi:hypothetical protein